jgi:hypothetical protein
MSTLALTGLKRSDETIAKWKLAMVGRHAHTEKWKQQVRDTWARKRAS